MTPPATRIGLIRHAQTAWNREKRLQGRRDSPLGEIGTRQARAWGKALAAFPWDACVASPQGRALDTARAVCRELAIPLETEDLLREQDWGAWEGRTLASVRADCPDELARRTRAGWDFRPPGGESRREVLGRALEAVAAIARRHPGRNILAVTHQGVVKCLLYYLCGRAFLPEEPPLLPKGWHLHLVRSGPSGAPVIEKILALTLSAPR